MAIKVVVADDTDLMRTTIIRLLSGEPSITVVGEAANFAESLQQTEVLKPDVLLLDLRMPDERQFSPQFLKSQLVPCTGCIIGIRYGTTSMHWLWR